MASGKWPNEEAQFFHTKCMSILLRLFEAPKINSHLIMSTYHYEFVLEDEMVKFLNVDYVQPSAIGEKSALGEWAKHTMSPSKWDVNVGLKLGRIMTHLTLHYSIIVIWNM